MERMIPAWGLYRLFSALEKKGGAGTLTLHFPDGSVRFRLRGGRVVDGWTDVDGISFPEFLVQAGMVQDRSAAESFTSVDGLVEAGLVAPGDSKRFYGAYLRGIVDIILPAPVISWMFEPATDDESAVPADPVDMCTELFTAIQRNVDLAAMRTVVSRLGPMAKINDGFSRECFAHARAHFKGVSLVTELGSGYCPPITPALLGDETNLRILFGFFVAGGLVSASSGAGALSEVPVSAVSESVDDGFDEFRVTRPGPATSFAQAAASVPVVEPAAPVAPGPTPPAAHDPVSGYAHADSQGDDALDLAVDPDARGRSRNFQRDDYLVMGDDGAIRGFGSTTPVRPQMPAGVPFVDPELDRAIQSELGRAARLNHYELLEIAHDARVSAVRMAVLRARRRYSPSRYEGGVSPESMKALQGLIERIVKVGELFSDLNLRVAYNRSQNISTPGLEAQLAAIFDARNYWREGMQLLDQRKAAEALELFEAAENCDAEEPDFFCAQGQALLALPPASDTMETIESLLDVAFSFDPDLVAGHLLAADYMVRRNDFEAAQGHIRKVLALDPDNREARAFRMKAKASRASAQVSFKKKPESLLQKALKLIKR